MIEAQNTAARQAAGGDDFMGVGLFHLGDSTVESLCSEELGNLLTSNSVCTRFSTTLVGERELITGERVKIGAS